MPAYDYRCASCGTTFEVRRPLAAAADAPRCPAGHADVRRVFTAVAVGVGGATRPGPAAAGGGPAAGGGCCGGGCCGG